jgi:short-subunit dehydrogenase
LPLPPPRESSTALITGASSGIGAAMARELGIRGHGVVLAARREQRLRDLARELQDAHGIRVEVLVADLGDVAGRDGLAKAVEGLGLEVEILVNNAGFGDSGDFVDADRERLMEMLRLNCEAVIDLQGRYLPGMVSRARGAVINVASTAAFQPIPGNAAYAASKAFVLSLTEAVHAEVGRHGVSVTALCPGPVKTEFAEMAGIGHAHETAPGFVWTPVETVAAQAIEGAENGKRVVVPGLLNRAGALTAQHSPRALLLPVAKRIWRQAL